MDVTKYKKIIETCFPQFTIHSITPILDGWDYLVLDVNGEPRSPCGHERGEYIFRFPKRRQIEADLAMEMKLLPKLSGYLSIPIPEFQFAWHGGKEYRKRFAGYRKIKGIPLQRNFFTSANRRLIARQISVFISQLHRIPVHMARDAGVESFTPMQWKKEHQRFYARIKEEIFPFLEGRLKTASVMLWEEFLERRENFKFKPVLVHQDLRARHILYEPRTGRISGIIDWSDVAVGDLACEFASLCYDYGYDFAKQVISGYKMDAHLEDFRKRAAFYCKITTFLYILSGLEIGKQECLKEGISKLKAQCLKKCN